MRIVFHDNSANGVACQQDLQRPLGGRVTCLKEVSTCLARKGLEVELLMPGIPAPFQVEGATWTSRATGSYDAFVHVRGLPEEFPPVPTKKRYLWVRDLPHAGLGKQPELFKELDATVFLSQYAERIWRIYFQQIGRSVTIPNGVSDLFHPGQKDRGLIVHVAHPIRGLKYLPEIWEALKLLHPKARLVAFSDASLHPGEGTSEEYDQARQACVAAGVDVRSPVPQEELADWLRRAEINLMPSGYPEICSNTILQSLRCGTPVVTTGGLGSAPEWIVSGRNGVLTQTRPEDYMVYRLELARISHSLLTHSDLLQRLQQGAAATLVPTWEEVADRWLNLLST